jgi:hypothetical protein
MTSVGAESEMQFHQALDINVVQSGDMMELCQLIQLIQLWAEVE